jgi:undecaprenyl-diphosphatase
VSFFQAIIIGVLQGVTELFPVSSLGHSVLVPAWLGWNTLLQGQSANESFFLAFVVGLHVATAAALVVFFWQDWVAIVGGLLTSVRSRRIDTPAQRLGWLLVLATIPVGLVGLAFEHPLRTLFAKPLAAAIFLTINGLILAFGEWLRRRERSEHRLEAQSLDKLPTRDGVIIGSSQIGALFAGISRSASRWCPGCFVASTTTTRRGSRSCLRRRSSPLPASTSCPTSSARSATASAGRCWSAA